MIFDFFLTFFDIFLIIDQDFSKNSQKISNDFFCHRFGSKKKNRTDDRLFWIGSVRFDFFWEVVSVRFGLTFFQVVGSVRPKIRTEPTNRQVFINFEIKKRKLFFTRPDFKNIFCRTKLLKIIFYGTIFQKYFLRDQIVKNYFLRDQILKIIFFGTILLEIIFT